MVVRPEVKPGRLVAAVRGRVISGVRILLPPSRAEVVVVLLGDDGGVLALMRGAVLHPHQVVLCCVAPIPTQHVDRLVLGLQTRGLRGHAATGMAAEAPG